MASEAPQTAQSTQALTEAAFKAMPLAVFLLDENGGVLRQNQRAEQLFGDAPDTGPDTASDSGQSPTPFSALCGLDAHTLRTTLTAAVPSGRVELPMTTASQIDTVPFHLSEIRPDGAAPPLYVLVHDPLKPTADALRQAHDTNLRDAQRMADFETQIVELQRTVFAVEGFTHAASHDLRTPINALMGLLDLFTRKFQSDLPEAALPYLGHMRRAAGKMDALTDQLLKHARSGAAPLDTQPVALQDAIDDALSNLDPTLRLNASKISSDGTDIAVLAEPTMLDILLGNVLSNALKHRSDARALFVAVRVTPQEDGAVLTISDTGRGFHPDKAEAIFLPFQRLDRKVDGSGIGLATCSEICQRHGWTIAAQSDGKSGATFTITFPTVHLP